VAATKAKGGANRIHVIAGSDESEIKRAARRLADSLTPPGDFGSDIVDGSVDYAEHAAQRIHQTVEALLTFPFFGGEKLVWLKNATFLDDSPTGRAEAVVEALETLTEVLRAGLPEKTHFLLSAIGVDKRRTFYKALQKLADIAVFDAIDPGKSGWELDAMEVSRTLGEQKGLAFDGDALELCALFTGGDRRTLENEIEKLDLFLGPNRRRVTVADVRSLVALSRTGVIFELGNALAERNLTRCLSLHEQLIFQGETAIGLLLATIIPTVRSLLIARDLMTRHKISRPPQPFAFARALEKLPAAALAHLPRKKDGTVNFYTLGLAAVNAHRYQLEELRAALKACLDANVRLITTSLDPSIILSQLLVTIAAPARTRTTAAKR
jgi:DNA polymerase-3 subunit delta